MVTYNLTLDMSTDQVQKMLTVKLGDTDRRIIFTLSNAGSPYKIPSGTTAQFFARKPDANVIYADCTIIGDTIGYTFGEETATAVGILECELRLYSSTQESLSTPKFNIRVTDNAYADGTITSHSDFSALTTAISTANNAATVASVATTAANNLNAAVTKSGSTATITITKKDGTTESASISDGDKGDIGATPVISVTATVNQNTGTPSVSVTKSGTDENPSFAFAFSNVKGDKGADAVTDAHYSPTSDNAQSGKAVAEALANKQDKFATIQHSGSADALVLEKTTIITGDLEVPALDSNAGKGRVVNKQYVNESVNPIMRYIEYSIDDTGEVTITGCDTSISGDYEIPEKIEGHPVTIIGESAFENCTSLKSIILPCNVRAINNKGFKNCSALKKITHSYVAGEVQFSIWIDAFYGCNSLTDVYIIYNTGIGDTIRVIKGSGNGKYTAATKHFHQEPAVKQDIYDYTQSYTTAEKTKLSGIEAGAEVNKIDTIKVNGTTQQISNKGVDISMPTKTSDLTNDSNFVTHLVNNLANYYLKSETYTKEEVQERLAAIKNSRFSRVQTLPPIADAEENVIYLVPRTSPETEDIYDEYIKVEVIPSTTPKTYTYEKIGNTQVDLTGYATETWVNAQISNFLTQSQVETIVATALSSYYTKAEIDTKAEEFATAAQAALATKQDKEDNTLQTESKNIVGAINELNSRINLENLTWKDIRNMVRLGLAPEIFPVGYEFITFDSANNRIIIWVVIGHDHHKAADASLKHTMTIQVKAVYSDASGNYIPLQFGNNQALYYTINGLEAGSYYFQDPTDPSQTYEFTLHQPIPAGGQLVYSSFLTSSRIFYEGTLSSYASATSTTPIETNIRVVGSPDPEQLPVGTSIGGINNISRLVYGSNNYAQSAIRQLLNSDGEAGTFWTPQTRFDRPPSWNSNLNGFMHGLPEDFLAVVKEAVVPCRTNAEFEVNSLDGTVFHYNEVYELHDKFFILSRGEISGTYENSSYKDGTQLEYYASLTTAAERIKYDANGTARQWFTRTPWCSRITSYPATYREYTVYTGGSYGGISANSNMAIAPACIIA